MKGDKNIMRCVTTVKIRYRSGSTFLSEKRACRESLNIQAWHSSASMRRGLRPRGEGGGSKVTWKTAARERVQRAGVVGRDCVRLQSKWLENNRAACPVGTTGRKRSSGAQGWSEGKAESEKVEEKKRWSKTMERKREERRRAKRPATGEKERKCVVRQGESKPSPDGRELRRGSRRERAKEKERGREKERERREREN